MADRCEPHVTTRFSPLKVELCRGTREWRLLEPLRWTDPVGHEHIVPRNFLTDFASVPRVFRMFALNDSLTAAPACLHDFAYRVTRPGRRWADDLFFHALRSNGAPAWAAWSYWLAVRLFGWIPYRKASP